MEPKGKGLMKELQAFGSPDFFSRFIESKLS